MNQRERALAEARAWLGTPYRHQASVKGAGCDCLGLIRGVYRALYGAEPEAPPPYTPDWAEIQGEETLLHAASRHLRGIPVAAFEAGDVLLFRAHARFPAKHAAIAAPGEAMIHAYAGRSVCETALGPWWRRRIAAAFAFPDTPTDKRG